jgi:hypothetical protein
MDFERHNAEVREVWKTYHEGRPVRVPMTLGISARYLMFNDDANPSRATFTDLSNDPDIMLQCKLEHQWWIRHNVVYDAEMGMPAKGWAVGVDFQNYYEAVWFGCPLEYRRDEVPDARPFLTDDRKRMIFDNGLPGPFSGLMGKNREFYEHMKRRQQEGLTFKGLPIASVIPCGLGTDGPFTVASCLRGAAEICLDLYEDPRYAEALLDFITDATLARITEWRKLLGQPEMTDSWGFADDSVQLLSCDLYRQFVLPRHKRLMAAFARKGPNSVHLCGDAYRLFKTLHDELNITTFDTGFPIDLAKATRELGPEVRLQGGIHVTVLRDASPAAVREESRRILLSGVKENRKFIFRDANNLAPHTPLENIRAMHEAVKEFGRY